MRRHRVQATASGAGDMEGMASRTPKAILIGAIRDNGKNDGIRRRRRQQAQVTATGAMEDIPAAIRTPNGGIGGRQSNGEDRLLYCMRMHVNA